LFRLKSGSKVNGICRRTDCGRIEGLLVIVATIVSSVSLGRVSIKCYTKQLLPRMGGRRVLKTSTVSIAGTSVGGNRHLATVGAAVGTACIDATFGMMTDAAEIGAEVADTVGGAIAVAVGDIKVGATVDAVGDIKVDAVDAVGDIKVDAVDAVGAIKVDAVDAVGDIKVDAVDAVGAVGWVAALLETADGDDHFTEVGAGAAVGVPVVTAGAGCCSASRSAMICCICCFISDRISAATDCSCDDSM